MYNNIPQIKGWKLYSLKKDLQLLITGSSTSSKIHSQLLEF